MTAEGTTTRTWRTWVVAVALTAALMPVAFGLGRSLGRSFRSASSPAAPVVLAVPSADVPWLGEGRPWAPAAPPPVGAFAGLAETPTNNH